MVLFNATDKAQTFTADALKGLNLVLHPALAQSNDSVVKGATFTAATGAFTIPARTTAVFVEPTTQEATITIALTAEPQSRRNFKFEGTLGKFKLDHPQTDDGDRYHNSMSFTVTPGSYKVKEEVPGSWSLASITCSTAAGVVDLAKASVTISVAAGSQITCTFANQERSALRVRVYHDKDGDGHRDGGEKRLKGWTISLYNAAGAKVARDKSDGDGSVRFSSLRPGAYTVCEQLREGWFNSQPGTLLPAFDNQPCYQLTIAPAQTWTAWFGNHQEAALAQGANADATIVADGLTMLTVVDDTDDEGYETDVTAIDEELLNLRLYLPLATN